jgi:hypothetical protein
VHTLFVGQHTSLTQTVPLGQHMVEPWHTLFAGQHWSLKQSESGSQHVAPQQTEAVGGQVWPSGQHECPGRHSCPDSSHFSCVHGRRGSQNSGASWEKQEPPGPRQQLYAVCAELTFLYAEVAKNAPMSAPPTALSARRRGIGLPTMREMSSNSSDM